jgi:hypothetical protein
MNKIFDILVRCEGASANVTFAKKLSACLILAPVSCNSRGSPVPQWLRIFLWSPTHLGLSGELIVVTMERQLPLTYVSSAAVAIVSSLTPLTIRTARSDVLVMGSRSLLK